jgi:hypothetical protein
MDDVGNEERDAVESIARDGQAVHTMVNTNGWKEVVRPALDRRKVALMSDFQNAKVYEEFVAVQQAVNAIDSLINFIESTLIEGKEALIELRDAEHP